ncbi:MAG: hypothetical protein IJV69_08455 [Kiritimatiellae bacterium]|nr:hypothetical protein [Kiritimatiellia bacterium]
MNKMLTLAGVTLALMTGCLSVNTNDGAITTDIKIRKVYTPNIEVQQTAVSGEATVNCLFGFITWGVSEYADDAFVKTGPNIAVFASADEVAKQGATYQACDAAKADYLLGAKYRLDTADYFVFKTVKCTATGYPGTIKGVKAVKTTATTK